MGHRAAQANWGRVLMAGLGVAPNPTMGGPGCGEQDLPAILGPRR